MLRGDVPALGDRLPVRPGEAERTGLSAAFVGTRPIRGEVEGDDAMFAPRTALAKYGLGSALSEWWAALPAL